MNEKKRRQFVLNLTVSELNILMGSIIACGECLEEQGDIDALLALEEISDQIFDQISPEIEAELDAEAELAGIEVKSEKVKAAKLESSKEIVDDMENHINNFNNAKKTLLN
jgi:hypothetical protein